MQYFNIFNKSIDLSEIDVLLFDLGKVIIDFDFNLMFVYYNRLSGVPIDELKSRFTFDDEFKNFERGQITEQLYLNHLKKILQLNISLFEIKLGFNSIFTGIISETYQAIYRLNHKRPVYVLSNTNSCHEYFWSSLYRKEMTLFDEIFCSHKIGFRKPETNSFESVVKKIGSLPERILFFDDIKENTNAAEKLGFKIFLVTN